MRSQTLNAAPSSEYPWTSTIGLRGISQIYGPWATPSRARGNSIFVTMKPTSPAPLVSDMSPAEFRKHGYAVIDWIADYLDAPEKWPVLSAVQPGDVRHALPPSPPERGESMDEILGDFQRLIVPATTHWNHPAFMA